MPTTFDYQDRPDRYRRGMAASEAYRTLGTSLYDRVAGMLRAAEGTVTVLDLGCGSGPLAAALAGAHGTMVIGVDKAWPLLLDAQRHGPVIHADVTAVPVPDGAVDAAVAVNVLDHLDNPVDALQEAHRVLKPGGLFVAGTISRYDSPELVSVWSPTATPFDSEDAPGLVSTVFGRVGVDAWDAPLLTLPHPTAVSEYLQARLVPPQQADQLATQLSRTVQFPLSVTKRGSLITARR